MTHSATRFFFFFFFFFFNPSYALFFNPKSLNFSWTPSPSLSTPPPSPPPWRQRAEVLWAETNQDFRRHKHLIHQNFRIPDGVFAVLLSPLVLIYTLVAAGRQPSSSPIFQLFCPHCLGLSAAFFSTSPTFNLLLVLFAILTGIFSSSATIKRATPSHPRFLNFPENPNTGMATARWVGVALSSIDLIHFTTWKPNQLLSKRNILGLKAGRFPDDGRKIERYSSQGNLISADTHFQRHPGFGERSLGSPSSSSADAPPKTSKIDHDFLIQRRRSSTSFPRLSTPLEDRRSARSFRYFWSLSEEDGLESDSDISDSDSDCRFKFRFGYG